MRFSFTAVWRTTTKGLRGLVNSKQSDADIRDEMQHYLEMETADAIRGGLDANEARRRAQLIVGNRTVMQEGVRASLWETVVGTFMADVRYSLRMLRRSPIFTIVIVSVISLGTGAVTTIFSAANALLFRPLPGAQDPDRLVQLDRIDDGGKNGMQASGQYYKYLRDNNRTLSGLAA